MSLPSLNLFLPPPTGWWRWLSGLILLAVIRGSTFQAVPAGEPPLKIAAPRHNHWSFQPPHRLELPDAEHTDRHRMFDIPDVAESCTRRIRSNTPLQALTLLSDPWFVEFGVALADRILREKPAANDTQKILHAFGLCLARSPKPTELEMLMELVDRQRKTFQEEPHRTKELIDSIELAMSNLNLELATWTAVSRALLNLGEFITRE